MNGYIDPLSESHRKRVYARFDDIFPYLGSRPIAEIESAELDVIRKIENRDAKDTAHRTLGSCGQVFRYGVTTRRCTRDITADLRGALKPVEEQHFAAVTTAEEIGGILRAIDVYKGTFVVRSAFRLAPLVFVRPGELRQAKWAEMNVDADFARRRGPFCGRSLRFGRILSVDVAEDMNLGFFASTALSSSTHPRCSPPGSSGHHF